MTHRIFLSLFALSALLFLGAGCTFKFGGASQEGVFKTINAGEVWTSKSVLVTSTNRAGSIGNLQMTILKIDPRDGNKVFAGTSTSGLMVSENGGETWTNALLKENVVDIALDSSSRCVVYVLTPKRVLKTTDCARTWNIIYDETRTTTILTSVESDPVAPEIIYFTTTKGDIFKSFNRGVTWTAVYRMSDVNLSDLIVDRSDSNILYLAASQNRVFRSLNKGISWEDVSSGLSGGQFYNASSFRWMGALYQHGGILFANQKGMYRSLNMGTTWEQIPLLTPTGDATILAVVVNPGNDDNIFYATPTTFYKTTDGGAHWNASPLPSQFAASSLVIDPYNTGTIYMGMKIYKAPSLFY